MQPIRGGACETKFTGETFEEIAKKSKIHAKKMFKSGDASHLAKMQEMQALMSSPEDMKKWFDERKAEFDSLPNLWFTVTLTHI
jgi:hypothetical protein